MRFSTECMLGSFVVLAATVVAIDFRDDSVDPIVAGFTNMVLLLFFGVFCVAALARTAEAFDDLVTKVRRRR